MPRRAIIRTILATMIGLAIWLPATAATRRRPVLPGVGLRACRRSSRPVPQPQFFSTTMSYSGPTARTMQSRGGDVHVRRRTISPAARSQLRPHARRPLALDLGRPRATACSSATDNFSIDQQRRHAAARSTSQYRLAFGSRVHVAGRADAVRDGRPGRRRAPHDDAATRPGRPVRDDGRAAGGHADADADEGAGARRRRPPRRRRPTVGRQPPTGAAATPAPAGAARRRHAADSGRRLRRLDRVHDRWPAADRRHRCDRHDAVEARQPGADRRGTTRTTRPVGGSDAPAAYGPDLRRPRRTPRRRTARRYDQPQYGSRRLPDPVRPRRRSGSGTPPTESSSRCGATTARPDPADAAPVASRPAGSP